jgi:predicted DNA-binding protein YlxM (UPF0122 family)
VIINRKYLRQLIEQVISEQELSPQEIEDAPRSDQALMDAIEKLEARLNALEQELEAVKRERDNALAQMRAVTGQQ